MTERFGFRVISVHPGLVTSDYGVHEVGVSVCGVQHVLGVRVQPGTRHFPYNENPTRALNITTIKWCYSSTDAIERQKKITHADTFETKGHVDHMM